MRTGQVYGAYLRYLGYTMLFPALASGACVTVIDERDALDPWKLARRFAANPVDHLKIVPTHLPRPPKGRTLVVDTVHILPQVPLAISEAAGVPNNGDMHVIERIHLADKDTLHVDLEIFAPKILTKPWKWKEESNG